MKFSRKHTLKEIAEIITVDYVGEDHFPVLGINEIHRVVTGDIVFVDHPKYYDKALNSDATIILINKKVKCPDGKALLVSDNPFDDFNKLSHYFFPFVSQTEQISNDVQIGEKTIVQPGVFIEKNVVVGKNTVIHANVTLYNHCVIGDDVIIHSGTVIGADGFYFQKRGSKLEKLKSVGRVVVGNRVEIGSNCSIDKGIGGDTTIGADSKLDNLIQIGHDTIVGKSCIIASQTGIAGCTTIGDDVTIWGQVGIGSDLTIENKVVVLAQSGVTKNLEGGKTYVGYPAEEVKIKYKQMASLRMLPDLIRKSKDNIKG